MTESSTTNFEAQLTSSFAGRGRDLDTPVQYAKDVGPRTANVLEKLGIFSVRQLLYHFPRHYEDRTQFARVASLEHGNTATIRGAVIAAENAKAREVWCLRRC